MEASVRKGAAPAKRPARSKAARGGLKVALVHDWLTGMRGGEKCLEVLCRTFPDAPLYTLLHREGALSPAIEAMDVHTSPLQQIPGILRNYRKLLPLMPLATRSWRPEGVDLVVSLSHCVAKSVRVPAGIPHVCYCFTPMRYAWQGQDAYLESWRDRPLRRFAAKCVLKQMQGWDCNSSRGVTHFVAISETVRSRIATCYGRDSRVISPPVDTEFYCPDPAVERESFYLCVSALVPYKRLDHAVTACSILGRKLVVIGDGDDRARLERQAGPTVKFLGWQPDEVIRDHYRRCKALLFPGEEDFGIVPVEALSCGAPVIALGLGGAAETIDETVGHLYTRSSPEALIEAIEDWEARGDQEVSRPARTRAEAYALPRFRERLLGFLESVVSGTEGDRVPPAPHVAIPRGLGVD